MSGMVTNFELRAVDLFCGVGGLTRGLENAGVEVVVGVDIDPTCEYPYSQNNCARFEMHDVESSCASQIISWFGDADLKLLGGCAPCQPFSTYSRSRRTERSNHDWQVVAAFGNLILETRPDYVTMENVPQVADHQVFEQFLAVLGS